MAKMSPTQDLLRALEEEGVPRVAIARKLTISPSAVTELYADRRNLRYEEALVLLQMLGRAPRAGGVPLIGLAGAGNWVEAVSGTDRVATPPQLLEPGQDIFAVEIVGESMNLLLPNGSIAFVDPHDRDLYAGKLYLLQNAQGEATVKRYRVDPARFEPVSDDPSFEPISVGSDDFRVIGRVKAGIQKF
jgi:SOS-response transcriptional repressor LexA